MFIGMAVLGLVLTFGMATLILMSDNHSFTPKSCTKLNIFMQEVVYYYRYKTKVPKVIGSF